MHYSGMLLYIDKYRNT